MVFERLSRVVRRASCVGVHGATKSAVYSPITVGGKRRRQRWNVNDVKDKWSIQIARGEEEYRTRKRFTRLKVCLNHGIIG
jgi:hypothetical protein